MNQLQSLYPSLLWNAFAHICSIPHISKHESALASSILQMAKDAGHEAFSDSVGNVIVRIAASKGYETKPVLALQAHIDMVPQKNSATAHDFLTDPIAVRIDGEWVCATGTTLGADNGIGAAAMIAVMQDTQLVHGPLELVFTIDEEAGMGGAFGLKAGVLTAERLLNLDSEDDRDITIGCAGGLDATVTASIPYKPSSVLEPAYFTIALTGLSGGHSGVDINLGRANANLILSDVIIDLLGHSSAELVRFKGGNMRNAIPREAFATVIVSKKNADNIAASIASWERELQTQYADTDPNLSLKLTAEACPAEVHSFAKSDAIDFCASVSTAPNGVLDYEKDFPSVVMTSSNLSIAELSENGLHICLLLRSSSEDAKADLAETVREHFEEFAFTATYGGSYPGWVPDAHSTLLAELKTSYKKIMCAEPEIKIIHAGLECGIIGSKYPKMQMVSFGPTIKHPHSPDERVNIASVGKFWDVIADFVGAR